MVDDLVERIAEWAVGAKRGVAFTGAGISTESGIPDFRGPDGFWKRNDQAKFTIQNYVRDPEHRKERWRMALEGRGFLGRGKAIEPNTGHVALAKLEGLGCIRGVITQNIDGLHLDAGNQRVLELHGTNRTIGCLSCGQTWPTGDIMKRVEVGEEDPECTNCGGILKSSTISFGQQLPPDVVEEAQRWSMEADFFLVVGSSLLVYPAASFPQMARQVGAKLAIVNREPTEQDATADAVIHGDAGPTLSALVERVESLAKQRPDRV